MSRNLVHSRLSFSFNTLRRSGMGRLRAASKDMVGQMVTGDDCQYDGSPVNSS